MQESTISRRQCPTRPNGAEVLIEQRISGTACQERQRKHYHKCFSCIHRNDLKQSGGQSQPSVALPPIERAPMGAIESMPKQSAPAAKSEVASSNKNTGPKAKSA